MLDEINRMYITEDKIIHLTPLENRALSLLIKNKRSVVTNSQLCRAMYSCELDKYLKNCIHITIHRLKKKLEGEIQFITKSGMGYFIQ